MTKLVLALFLTFTPAVVLAQDPDPLPPPDSTAAPQGSLADEQASDSPLSSPRWDRRIEAFADDVRSGSDVPGQGQALYDSLNAAVERSRAGLADALRRRAVEEASRRDAEMIALYESREALLRELDETFRIRRFALTVVGMREVLGELEFFWLHSRFETLAVRSTAAAAGGRLINDPLGWIPGFLKIALAVLAFLWWRITGAPKLVAWRRRLVEIRPVRRQNVRLAKGLWYFDRIRAPVEWLAIWLVIVNVTAARTFGPALFLWAFLKWILIGWTAVLWVDALAARGAVGRRDRAPLRRKTLWTLCWWLVGFLLGRQLVRDFFGQGALFHWVSVALLLLLLPLTVLVVVWWRDEVLERLDAGPHRPGFADRILSRRTGLRSYPGAAVGGIYLTFDGVRRWVLRTLGSSDLGRRALAQLSRSEIARQAEKEQGAEAVAPLPQGPRQVLLNGNAPLIEKVGRKRVNELAELFQETPGSGAVLVGPRGSGKTTVLTRVAERLADQCLLVTCPLRSVEGLIAEIADELSLSRADSPDVVAAALRSRERMVVAIDDIHRLARPVIGGMEQLDRLRSFTRAAGSGVSWLYGADATAWEYVRRFQEVEPVHNHVSHLEPWGEEEIGRLLESRAEAAGIDPDFSRLVLPRQLDDRTYESLDARNRAGFARVLWDDCGGNPAVALHLWADSLAMDGPRVVVRLSHPPGPGDLDALSPSAFFMLRTLLRLETATVDEIADCLPGDVEIVEDAIQLARSRGMVEERDGRLTIGWRWYRAIQRALARRNMME